MFLKNKQTQYYLNIAWFLYAMFLSTIASLYSIYVYSPFSRPIWFDEFLQFAFFPFEDIGEAWRIATVTNQDINHGQTNFLMLVQFVFLKSGAPILVALRGPSIVATWLMFFGVLAAFRVIKAGPLWGVVAVTLIALQSNFLIHSGEARPYIFLVAAISLTLAYYLNRPELRTGIFLNLIGYLGVAIGCLFHPYFSLYWAAIFLSTYLGQATFKWDEFSLNYFFKSIDLPLLFFGSFIYFGLGYFTWFIRPPVLEFEPFQFMSRNIFSNVVINNFEFLLQNKNLFLVAIFFVSLRSALSFKKSLLQRRIGETITPILIIASSVVIPLVLSYISFRAGYWILTRQWVGSFFLAPLGFTMLISSFFRQELQRKSFDVIHIAAPVALLSVIFPFLIHKFYVAPKAPSNLFIAGVEIGTLIDKLPQKEINWVRMADAHYSSLQRIEIQSIADKYVLYANQNILEGGGVNPAFKNFYCTVNSVRVDSILFSNCFK